MKSAPPLSIFARARCLCGSLPRELDTKCNCYIATIIALFIAFSLAPAWTMIMACLISQPLSGALRAKAVYRVICTFIGGAAMIATDGRRRA
jgi:hypothetical protein